MKGGKLDKKTMKLIRKEYLRKSPQSYLCVRHNELCRKSHSFIYCMYVLQDSGKIQVVLFEFSNSKPRLSYK